MKITGKTKITGLLGYPVEHSLSPVFQNAAFEFLLLDYVYVPMEVEPGNIAKAMEGVRALNFAGLNLTVPHKKGVVPHLDEIDSEAEMLLSVNTVVNNKGRLKGYSTDGSGFMRSLEEREKGFDPKGKTVFILGAGGSSYAIAGALAKAGVSAIFICNRTEEKASLLKSRLSEKFGFKNAVVVPFEQRNDRVFWKDAKLLVNTTSVGMKDGDPLLINRGNLASVELVYDLIYNRKTELLSAAENIGAPCLGGLSMLVCQGAVSFELWTGKKAPLEVMKRALRFKREGLNFI